MNILYTSGNLLLSLPLITRTAKAQRVISYPETPAAQRPLLGCGVFNLRSREHRDTLCCLPWPNYTI
jgi:hypothetical protein